MLKNYIPYCLMNIPTYFPYIEVDNNTLNVNVSFTINYITYAGSPRTLHSPVFGPNVVERLNLDTRSHNVHVYIYNRSTPQPTELLSGILLRVKKTCFEVNGTLATARCREVNC